MTWDAIALRYPKTDKGSTGHGYMRWYQERLGHWDVRRMLEIGVASGDSLRMWHDIWPDAEVWGVDIAEGDYADDLRVIVGDAGDPEAMAQVPGPFDVIVDDGSHQFEDIAAAMAIFADRLAPSGVYVIEDTHIDGNAAQAKTEEVMRLVEQHAFRRFDAFSRSGGTYIVAAER